MRASICTGSARALLVGQSFDQEVRVDFSEDSSGRFQVLGRPADDGVRVRGQPFGAVRSGSYAPDE